MTRARLQLQVESMFPRPISVAEVEQLFARLTRFDRPRERDPVPVCVLPSGTRSSPSAKSQTQEQRCQQVGRHTHLHFSGLPRRRHSFAIHKALITPSISLTRGGSTSSSSPSEGPVLNLAPSDCSAQSSFAIGSDGGGSGGPPPGVVAAAAARASERSRRGV